MPVRRFDFLGPVHKLETTAQGFVRVDARLTRTGIFTYHQDGQPIRELRLPEEVFRDESLKSIAGAPVTDLHPESFVTPENAKELSIGFAGEDIVTEGDFVSAKLTITDAAAIERLKSGTRKEISLGYTCDVEHLPGTHNGEHYDAVQKNIIVNHIALGPPGWGRAGRDVALKLDAKEKIVAETTNLKLNDVDYEVSKDVRRAILAEFQRRDSANERNKGRLDALEKEIAKERQLREQAQDPKLFESRLNERLQLLQQCQKILGDARLDGKNDRELKELVIRKDNPEINLADKKESYIDGMFEAVVSNHNKRNDSLASAHIAANGPEPGAQIDDIVRKWHQDARDMWKRPLASHA